MVELTPDTLSVSVLPIYNRRLRDSFFDETPEGRARNRKRSHWRWIAEQRYQGIVTKDGRKYYRTQRRLRRIRQLVNRMELFYPPQVIHEDTHSPMLALACDVCSNRGK